MDNQPSTGGSIVPVKRDGEDLVDEQIDERILRLLGLEYIFDIDYDTYTSLLKEKMVAARMAKTQIPTEEAELLTNEYKKIRGKKGRFKVKKITADSFKKGSAVGINLGKQNVLIGKSQLALPPADKMTGGSDIKEIIDALAEIIKSLTSQNKLAKDSAEKSRIAGEAGQRGAKESRLEKGFKFAIKAAEKIIAPIKSLLDRIIDFFVAIFVGRALIKLLDWFSDSKNQDKIKAIGRFLGDQWPKLLALYIMFGTGLGKFVGFLTKIVIGGSIKLAIAAARLLAKAGVGKAAGAAKFLGGRGGKIAGAVLGVAATVGTTMAVSKGIENFGGIGGEEQKTQGYSGGGFVIPKFAGGGLNFKGMMGGAGMGAMFGPLGMLLGAGLGSGKIQETVSGLIGGKKGVDKVPAMLTDGEFVMSRGAVQKYGVDTLESMNAAGGGTNQPKIVSGTTYAAGGGMIGETPKEVKLRKSYDYRFGKDFTSKLTNDQLSSISKHYNSLPDQMSSAIESRRMQGYPDELKDMAERMIKGEKPKSFVEMSRAAAGLTDLEKNLRLDEKISSTLKYGNDLPKLNKPKSLVPKIDPGRMLPAAGQSSANMMKAVRAPIPASRAIVPYTGGGALARQGGGALATNPLQRINTNMNVPGGKGIGKGGLAGTIVTTLVEMFKPQIQEAVGNVYNKMGIGMGNLSDKDLKKQIMEEMKITKSVSSQFGGDLINSAAGDDRLRLLQKELDKRNLNQGGAIKGGFGLKDQSFKDMPKTQIMSDDKGRPFVGYKSMRGGKPVYVRGPQPGEGTSNPLEMMGRMINPGAYKDVDALSEQKKYQQASAGSISSLKARGASQLTLANRQSQLKKSIPAVPSKSKVKVVYGAGSGGRGSSTKSQLMGSGASPSVPSFSAVHPNSENRRRNAAVLGVK